MAFLIPEAVVGLEALAPEIVAGTESVFGGMFGLGEAAAVGSEVPVATAAIETSIIPSAAVIEAPALNAGVAAESSVKTLWSRLPALSNTTKVVGGAVALDSGYQLAQNIGDPNQSLKEAFYNVPGGVVKSATKLADYTGNQVGTVVGAGVRGASEGVFGNPDILWEVAIAAGAFYLWTR
eukprot:gene8996-biopygen3089